MCNSIYMAEINTHSVRELARLRGVSVSQLSREIEMDRSTLSSAINAGTRRIPIEKLLHVARALAVDPRALLGPDDVDKALRAVAA